MATPRTMISARKLWATDAEVTRDRADYASFDDMPPQLQEWWYHRAARKIDELRLLDQTGYPV